MIYQRKTSELTRHVEVNVTSEELCFSNILVGVMDVVPGYTFDQVICICHDLEILVPSVVA